MTEDKDVLFGSGVVRLTSHQLFWVDASLAKCFSLSHARIESVEEHTSGILHRRSQIRVFTVTAGKILRLDFDRGGRDKILSPWLQVLQRRLWEKKVVEKVEFSSSGAGIAGLMRRQEERNQNHARSVSEAFTDLDALVRSADDLVAIARRLQKISAKRDEASDVLSGLGIVAPLTKENCGSRFHEELARQICEFLLSGKLLLQSGMVSLPDVYCAYNRARGTSLISPEDLYRAAMLLEELALPLRLHEFASGVRVLQSAESLNFENRILKLFEESDSVAAFRVTEQLKVSMALAAEQLASLEDAGTLCRDDTIRGLFYFKNPWK